MSFNQLMHSDYIYETIKQSSYPSIRTICTTNKQISSFCATDPKIINLIGQKRDNVKTKTKNFLAKFGEQPKTWEFYNAVSNTNDIEILDELINSGYLNLNDKNALISYLFGNLDLLNRLLEDSRVDPSSGDNYAIKFASDLGYLNIVNRFLQDPRVDPSASDNAAIRWASRRNHTDVIKRLLDDNRVWNSLSPRQRKEYLKPLI